MKDEFPICYKCGRTATSQEHVPPKCLFPEKKDVKGLDFRKNLITVPSCDLHNSAKSVDDEFLLLSLSGIVTNNILGQFHFLTKANRALRRKSEDYINKQVLRNNKVINFKISEDEFKSILIGHPNVNRLINCFENIAYGLYFHEFKQMFVGQVKVFLGFLEYNDENMQTLKRFIKRRFEVEENLKQQERGDNPAVFTYEFQRPDVNRLISLRLKFYGKTEVFIAFKPDGVQEPFNLAMVMMSKGHKTVFKLDNEDFEFN